jgi:hypothetical protein
MKEQVKIRKQLAEENERLKDEIETAKQNEQNKLQEEIKAKDKTIADLGDILEREDADRAKKHEQFLDIKHNHDVKIEEEVKKEAKKIENMKPERKKQTIIEYEKIVIDEEDLIFNEVKKQLLKNKCW